MSPQSAGVIKMKQIKKLENPMSGIHLTASGMLLYIFYAYYRGQPKAGTGHKILSVPFFFSTSRFQGPAFRCDKIVVIVTLLAQMYFTCSVELLLAILRKTRGNGGHLRQTITFWGTTSSPIFTRDYFMSENLRADIYRDAFTSDHFYRESKGTYITF